MRNSILAIAALATAISAPVTARAQTVGVAPGTSAVVEDAPGIAVEAYPAFREYVVDERIPNHAIPGSVAVGTVLPEAGVTLYDVPPSFVATPYRYTVVNGEPVLVEPVPVVDPVVEPVVVPVPVLPLPDEAVAVGPNICLNMAAALGWWLSESSAL